MGCLEGFMLILFSLFAIGVLLLVVLVANPVIFFILAFLVSLPFFARFAKKDRSFEKVVKEVK